MKLRNTKRSLFSKASGGLRFPNISKRSIILLLSFGSIGALIVLAAHASTNSVSLESESGVKSGNVCAQSDLAASGKSLVRFGGVCKDIFVSTKGNDFNDGSTEALAVKTVTKAVALATGPARIRLMAGTYTETVSIQKNDLTIEPFGNGDVNIIGAIPEFISGVGWSYVQPGIYKYTLNRAEFRPDGNPIYDSNGKQQWSYPDIFQFSNRATVNNLPGVFLLNNFFGVSDVYVATSTGQPPVAPLYIGALRPTIDILNANNIKINGISGSKLQISYGSTNIRVNNSTNISITNVDVNCGMPGISAVDTSNLTIKNNIIHGTFDRTWTYSDVKDKPGTRSMEHEGVLVRANTKNVSNIVVDSNQVSAYFDGIQFTNLDGVNYTIDDSVISNNVIHDLSADGIEADSPFRNLVVKGNIVYDAYSPYSSAVAYVGPIYVYENLFVANRVDNVDPTNVDYTGMTTIGPSFSIKMNHGDVATENIHFYNNTFYFEGIGNTGGFRKTVDSTPTVQSKNVSFTNNIFYSYNGGILYGTGRAQDNVKWNGNVFYSEKNNADNYFAWNSLMGTGNSFPSLSSIVSSGKLPAQWTGNVEGNPNFNCVAPTTNSCFRPSATLTKPSSLQPIPNEYAESNRLNNRTRIGAFE